MNNISGQVKPASAFIEHVAIGIDGLAACKPNNESRGDTRLISVNTSKISEQLIEFLLINAINFFYNLF